MKVSVEDFLNAFRDFSLEVSSVPPRSGARFFSGLLMAAMADMYIAPGLAMLKDEKGMVDVERVRAYCEFGFKCSDDEFEIDGIPVRIKKADLYRFFNTTLKQYTKEENGK